MATIVPSPDDPIWETAVHEGPAGEPLTGGPPDLANNQGFLNVPIRQLSNRTAFLRLKIESHVAIAGVPIPAGRWTISADGALMQNNTGSQIVPTTTGTAALVTAGMTNLDAATAASNGSVYLGTTGLIMKWGSGQIDPADGDAGTPITFATAFPTETFRVMLSDYGADGTAAASHVITLINGQTTAGGFRAVARLNSDATLAGSQFGYLAIGR